MSKIEGDGDKKRISRPARSKCSQKENDNGTRHLAKVSNEVAFENTKDSSSIHHLRSVQNIGEVINSLDYEAKINVENLTSDVLYFKVRSTAPEKFQVVPTFGLITSSGTVYLTVRVTLGTLLHTIKYEKFQVQLMKAPQDLLSQSVLVAKLKLISKSEVPELGRSLSHTLNQFWIKYNNQGVHVESHCVTIRNPRLSITGYETATENATNIVEITKSVVPPVIPTHLEQPESFTGSDEGNMADGHLDDYNSNGHLDDYNSNGGSELEAQAKAILNCETKRLIVDGQKKLNFFQDSKGNSLLEKIEKLEQCAAKLEESSCQLFAWLRRTIVISILVTTLSLLLVSFSDSSAAFSDDEAPKQCSLREASVKQYVRWENLI